MHQIFLSELFYKLKFESVKYLKKRT